MCDVLVWAFSSVTIGMGLGLIIAFIWILTDGPHEVD